MDVLLFSLERFRSDFSCESKAPCCYNDKYIAPYWKEKYPGSTWNGSTVSKPLEVSDRYMTSLALEIIWQIFLQTEDNFYITFIFIMA